MKKVLQNRKTLYFVLSIVMVLVFTLSVAYAALSTVLEITGTAEVLSASWDIHLDNVNVKNGSVSTDTPVINDSSTLSFDVVLNKPGDYYEFTVDVVNDGTIDAMIDSVVKSPDLTQEQAKYFLYEVSYANGESISTKQTLKKQTSTPIKVRVAYRRDLTASDLPTSNDELSLSLTLVYAQSNDTGNSIPNNGVSVVNVVSGDGTQVGDEICINTECFYVISSTDEEVTMLAKYNLYVGGTYDGTTWTAYGDEASGKQDSTMRGLIPGQSNSNGTTVFSSDGQKGTNYSDYNGSLVQIFVNNYKIYLDSLDLIVIDARLISKDELEQVGCDFSIHSCSGAPSWICLTSYWSGSSYDSSGVFVVRNSKAFGDHNYRNNNVFGVRPVIVIPRNLL